MIDKIINFLGEDTIRTLVGVLVGGGISIIASWIFERQSNKHAENVKLNDNKLEYTMDFLSTAYVRLEVQRDYTEEKRKKMQNEMIERINRNRVYYIVYVDSIVVEEVNKLMDNEELSVGEKIDVLDDLTEKHLTPYITEKQFKSYLKYLKKRN